MAVVTKYGNGYPAPGAVAAPAAIDAEGQVRSIYSKSVWANGDSATSKWYIGRVPSNARILPQSTFYYEAIAGVTSLDIGFVASVNALVAAKDVSSAGSASMVSAIATGSLGKKAWEMAGLSSDPGGFLDVFATANQASTAANKAIEAFLYYAKG